MATETAARKFFTSPFFAVVGASSNPAKFGHKVHAWYLDHGLNVTPVNPGSSSVSVGGQDYATVPDLSGLPSPKQTSVSIITAPPVTVKVLEEAKKIGIPGIWLQPGTFDDAVLKLALEQGAFESVVYGDGGRGHDGWCVLVDGERAMKDAGKL
uniref:CoA-binding domain-containing protein n=1 Tax=Photinus pyralis TaxID=7054 RepID=A0A1Y1NPE4_PHOPY